MRLALLIAVAVFLTPASDPPRFSDIATAVVTDLQTTVHVLKADQSELKKISRDFGMAYRLKSVTMRYKRPGKLRMDGKIGQESALYIVNGSTRYYSVPRLKLSKKDDLGDSPGRRYSLLELGIASRGDVDAVVSRYLHSESLDGTLCHVFDISYKGDDTSSYNIWLDPKTRVIMKRDWLDAEGKLRASFVHKGPTEAAPGLWIPTRLEIRNGGGIVAAETEYTNVKVNQNISDTLFRIL